MKEASTVLTRNCTSLFFSYAVPTIIGMLAISSASVIDGIFVGNMVGAHSLAAVNLAMPFLGVTYSLSVMLSVGGSVQCGKLLGENKEKEASGVFSQVFLVSILISVLVSLPVLISPEKTVSLLGANSEILPDVIKYLKTYGFFLPLIFMGINLTSFVRMNQSPGRVSFALVFSALMNIFFDWLLIVNFDQGLKGAAVASGISQSLVFIILFPSVWSRGRRLYLTKPCLNLSPLLKTVFNGLSEFVNEISGSLIILVFNIVLIRNSGIDAVAAFTVINYLFYLWLMVAYSTGESIQAPVSINFGAGQEKRSLQIFKLAMTFNVVLGFLIVLVLFVCPEVIMNLFLNNSEETVRKLILQFLPLILPAFLLSGVNIVISSFLTARQKAAHSLIIALLRALIMPIGFIFFFNHIFDYQRIFLAIPMAEFVTLMVVGCMILFMKPNVFLHSHRTP